MPHVTAIISTYQRPDACERALASVLEQDSPPLEVIVADDGSQDATPERFRAWEARDSRVRYLRVEPNRGTPAPARNAAVSAARGDWVAFLDDDDTWLPGKLAAQLAWAEEADVIATNAVTTDGVPYFRDAPDVARPSRESLLTGNPVILSSTMARRDALIEVGCFPAEVSHVEDYSAWLALADRGARFVILGDPLVRYTSHGEDRYSSVAWRMEAAAARLAWRRALSRRPEWALYRAALNRTAGTAGDAVRYRLSRRP